jgi:hypothetical protein
MLASEEFDPIRTQLRGPGRNLICLIFGVCASLMTEGENDARRVGDQKRAQPTGKSISHAQSARGKSANNGARYGPNFAYGPRGAQVDSFSCRRGATKRAPISPDGVSGAHTFEFTPPPQRDTPARSFAKVADFGARLVIDSRNSLKLAAKRAQLITIVAANEPVKQLGTQINLSSLIALIVRPQPHCPQ